MRHFTIIYNENVSSTMYRSYVQCMARIELKENENISDACSRINLNIHKAVFIFKGWPPLECEKADTIKESEPL